MNAEQPQEIIIVEDERKIAELLRDYLLNAGYQVCILDDGTDAVEVIERNQPACVILDLMLPGKDGLQICRELRQSSDIPIIMVTARVDEIDRLLGLELGADDYICKPFSPREVVVRVRNILKRVVQQAGMSADTNEPVSVIRYRDLMLDSESMECEIEGKPVTLTLVEFRLLSAMLTRVGKIFSREQLMNEAYTDGRIVSDRTIDTHIKNLRKKLDAVSQQEYVYSIYGVGYKVN